MLKSKSGEQALGAAFLNVVEQIVPGVFIQGNPHRRIHGGDSLDTCINVAVITLPSELIQWGRKQTLPSRREFFWFAAW
jgi:hypothetical protein